MSVTEDEAMEQQCIGPRNCGRVIYTGSLDPNNFPRLCVGSRCKMGWRWDPRAVEWTVDGEIPLRGYCGLAGKVRMEYIKE